jgi:hypothetical protein
MSTPAAVEREPTSAPTPAPRRALELEGAGEASLDARAIVLGPPPSAGGWEPAAPAVVWQGNVAGDGTGPQSSYFVRLNADGSSSCQCPAFYFRGVLRRDPKFHCKHIQRALAALSAATAQGTAQGQA